MLIYKCGRVADFMKFIDWATDCNYVAVWPIYRVAG